MTAGKGVIVVKQYAKEVRVDGKVVGTATFHGPEDAREFARWVAGLTGDELERAYSAWLYGAGLKAIAMVRQRAMASADMTLTLGGQKVDLRSLAPDKAREIARLVVQAGSAGLNVGERNLARARAFLGESE